MIYPGVKRTMCRKGHSSPALKFTVANAIITLIFTFVSLFIQQSVDFPLLNHRFVYNCGRKRYNKSERRIAMDQVKIGKFIAERRKANNLTQMQLA